MESLNQKSKIMIKINFANYQNNTSLFEYNLLNKQIIETIQNKIEPLNDFLIRLKQFIDNNNENEAILITIKLALNNFKKTNNIEINNLILYIENLRKQRNEKIRRIDV